MDDENYHTENRFNVSYPLFPPNDPRGVSTTPGSIALNRNLYTQSQSTPPNVSAISVHGTALHQRNNVNNQNVIRGTNISHQAAPRSARLDTTSSLPPNPRNPHHLSVRQRNAAPHTPNTTNRRRLRADAVTQHDTQPSVRRRRNNPTHRTKENNIVDSTGTGYHRSNTELRRRITESESVGTVTDNETNNLSSSLNSMTRQVISTREELIKLHQIVSTSITIMRDDLKSIRENMDQAISLYKSSNSKKVPETLRIATIAHDYIKLLSVLQFQNPNTGANIFQTNSDPSDIQTRNAVQFALGNENPISNFDLDRLLNHPLRIDTRVTNSSGSLSRHVSRGQSRAHSQLSEYIANEFFATLPRTNLLVRYHSHKRWKELSRANSSVYNYAQSLVDTREHTSLPEFQSAWFAFCISAISNARNISHRTGNELQLQGCNIDDPPAEWTNEVLVVENGFLEVSI